MKNKEIRREIVEHAVRWSNNILAEVLSNHGPCIGDEARDLLSQAISNLAEVESAIRRAK
jgi:hypothetical protein